MSRTIIRLLDAAESIGGPIPEYTREDLERGSISGALADLLEEHLDLGDVPRLLAQVGVSEQELHSMCRLCLARAVVATPPGLRWAFYALRAVADAPVIGWAEVERIIERDALFWRTLGLYDALRLVADGQGALYALLLLTWRVCIGDLWAHVEEALELGGR